MESDRVVYFEVDFGFDGSKVQRSLNLEKKFIHSSVFVPERDVFYSVVDELVVGHNDSVVDEQDILTIADPYIPLRRSQRTRRSAIPDDYEVYSHEHDFDISDDSDPVTYEEAISSSHSNFWLDAM